MAPRLGPLTLLALVAACGPGMGTTLDGPQTTSSDTSSEPSTSSDPPPTTTSPATTTTTTADETSSTTTATSTTAATTTTGDPPCDPIHEGDLEITDDTPLAPLACLTEITGALRIEGTLFFTSFKELAGVHTIGDGVRISDNAALVDLDGLAGLRHVHCIDLGSCFARIDIESNPDLSNIKGLAALETVDTISLQHDLNLASLTGLTLGWDTFEADTPALLLGGLEDLVDLDDIAGVAPFDGELHLENNIHLVDISALGPHLAPTLGWVVIRGNIALPGLAGLEGVTAVDGLHLVDNDALADLVALAALTDVGSLGLEIEGHPALTSLHGLEQLTHAGDLEIERNHALTSLAALSALTVVDGELLIGGCFPLQEGNDALTSLAGLEALQSAEIVRFHQNDALVDVDVLLGLTGVQVLESTHNPMLDFLDVDALIADYGLPSDQVINCGNKGNPDLCPCPDPPPP